MENCVEYANSNSIQVELNDECNDDTGSETSDTFTAFSSLIQNDNRTNTDTTHRRVVKYMGKPKFLIKYDNQQIFSSQKSTRYNKSVKRFLFLFGLATMLIILSQIYLSVDIDGTTFGFSIIGWDRSRNRSIPSYILPDVNTTILEPSTLCKENSPILLLIVICSAADNFEKRQTLRQTWANTTEFNYSKFSTLHSQFRGKYLPINYPNWWDFTVGMHTKVDNSKHNLNVDFQIRTVFLLGQIEDNEIQDQIVSENRIHNDLIQESFLDTYNNLTLKTVMMLKWINNNCAGKVKFIMKCDDDTFVHVPNLIHFLLGGTIPAYNATFHRYDEKTIRVLSSTNRLSHYDDFLIGTRFCKAKPVLDTRSRWFVPNYMYDEEFFPMYLSGGGYVFNKDTAEKLYNVSMMIPLLHLEDVYLTGICAAVADIEPQNFHLFNFSPYKVLCEVKGMITLHQIQPNDMRKAYDFIMKSNVTCPPPNKRASFHSSSKSNFVC